MDQYSILFVDDEINILNALRRSFIDAEFTCYFVTSGVQALELLEREKITVLVSDMRMPQMDGLTLLKLVKERWPRTVRIVLSGYSDLKQVIAIINEVDIFKFITKPWSNENDIKDVLFKALEYYKLQEENEEFRKALQNKNIAYQNILKSLDENMTNAKKSNEFIRLCGKLIIHNMKMYKDTDKDTFDKLMIIQEELYDSLAKASISAEEEISAELLIDVLQKGIQSLTKISSNETDVDSEVLMKTYVKRVESFVYACISVFKEEFTACGLNMTMKYSKNNSFSISMVSPNAYAAHNAIKDHGLSILDIKVDFINSIFSELASLSKMSFCATKTNGSLFIVLSVN